MEDLQDKIIELMDLFDGEVTTADKIDIPKPREDVQTIEAINRFMRDNPLGKADGGRIGFRKKGFVYKPKKSAETVILTPEMVVDIAEKNPDFTATDILQKLDKDKTKNYVTRFNTPINRKNINRTLSETFDLAAEKKEKIPKGYVSSQEFFNTEGVPISKNDYMTIKNRNPSLLTDTIGKNSIFIKQGKGGEGEFFYKKPTKKDLELYQKIASRKGILKANTINLMFEFNKNFGKLYAKGKLPDLKTIQEKISKDITPSTAGNVTARLSQWYSGADFLNPQLKDLKRNKLLGVNIQKATDKFQFGNFYKDQAYRVALDTIDEKIGRQIGSFKAFKDNVKKALKEAGLPIYSKNSPFGFNLNEIAGVTGASRTKTAAFSDFVDIAEGKFNQGQLSKFQAEFAKVREQLDKLDLANNIQNRKKALTLINDFQNRIKYYEGETGSKLPNIGLGTADQYYSAEKLSDIAKERSVGETGKKKFRKIPGTDLLGASEKAGYTVIIPEDYRTVGQIMETGQRNVLKKNVQNTLEGMKKFFNEYDEKKMFQKLRDASPDTLKKMMKVIPKVVSIEDDFLNAYGFPLTAGLDSSIGIKPTEEDTFAEKNPITTQLLGSSSVAGTVLKPKPVRSFLMDKVVRPLGTYAAAIPYAAYNVYDRVKQGDSLSDAITDPLTALELSFPAFFKENVAKITKNPALQKVFNVGKYGRFGPYVGGGLLTLDALKNIARNPDKNYMMNKIDSIQQAKDDYYEQGEMFEKGGRAGFKLGTIRKIVKSKIDEAVEQSPKDTTTELDKLIKKTLDEDLFDKKDRIIDQINISEANKRKKYSYNQQVFEEPKNLDFYDAITKSNFRTKTGPYFDRIRRLKKAGGGLLKQAGDRSGPPPESGPNSQGLQGLLNRVKNT